MRIIADRSRCIGSGLCFMTAPDVFDQSDEDGCVLVIQEHPFPDREVDVERAVRHCPSGALRLANEDGDG